MAAEAGDSTAAASLEEYYSSSSEDLLSLETSFRPRSSIQSVKSSTNTSAGHNNQDQDPNLNGSQNYWNPPLEETADYTDSDEEGVHEVEYTFQRKSASIAALKKAAAMAAAQATIQAMEEEGGEEEQQEQQQQQVHMTEAICESMEEEESHVSITNMETIGTTSAEERRNVVDNNNNDKNDDNSDDEQDNLPQPAEVQQSDNDNENGATTAGDWEDVAPITKSDELKNDVPAPVKNDDDLVSGNHDDDDPPVASSTTEEVMVHVNSISTNNKPGANVVAAPDDGSSHSVAQPDATMERGSVSNSYIDKAALEVVGVVGAQTASNIAAQEQVESAKNVAGNEIFDRLYRNEKRPETVWKEPTKYEWPKSPPKDSKADEPVPPIFDQLYHNEKRADPVWHEPRKFTGPKSPAKTHTPSVSDELVKRDINSNNNNNSATGLPSMSGSKNERHESSDTSTNQMSKYETPSVKTKTTAPTNAATAATAASTLGSLTPPGSSESKLKPSKLSVQFESKPSSAIPPPENVESRTARTPVTSFSVPLATSRSIPAVATHREIPEDESPKNEFQMVKLNKRSPKAVERHIKESRLEFAELVANALTNKRESNVEAMRHIDNLKVEVAELEEEEDATQVAINKLRRELLDMFNQGSPMQEDYLLKWIMPLHRERDPKTGRLIMNADQVALLQSFKTSEEVGEIAGLGMVRSVLQSNFKAMNGAKCLNDIHEYAQFRLGKKSKRAPQNPWELLEGMFGSAEDDGDCTEDIHQRVCNALVQWVVREILGYTKDTITSRSCFHAIFLVASLKLELQRLAPAALEPASPVKTIQAGEDQWGTPNTSPHSPRNPYVEKLLNSNVLTEDKPSPSSPLRYRNPDTVTQKDEPTAQKLELNQSALSPSSGPSSENRHPEESPTIDKDKAMKEAMLVRDASARELKEANNASKESRIPESELPDAVRDSHRVIRCILGPNHPHINVSDCFEAIRLYASLIMNWKEIKDHEEASLMSTPTAEEEKLKQLEGCLTYQAMEPPLQIEIGKTNANNETTTTHHVHQHPQPRPSKAAKKKKPKGRKKDSTGTTQQSSPIIDFRKSLPEEPLDESSEVEQGEQGEEEHKEAPQKTPAQLDIESLLKDQQKEGPTNALPPKTVEEPPPTATHMADNVPLTDEKRELQKSIAKRTQKTIEATEVQAKRRKSLMDRLRRIPIRFVPFKKKSKTGSAASKKR